MEDFYVTSSQNLLNSGDWFCVMELEYTKWFLRFSRRYTAMSTVALLVASLELHHMSRM
jgi:hypothetical protein